MAGRSSEEQARFVVSLTHKGLAFLVSGSNRFVSVVGKSTFPNAENDGQIPTIYFLPHVNIRTLFSVIRFLEHYHAKRMNPTQPPPAATDLETLVQEWYMISHVDLCRTNTCYQLWSSAATTVTKNVNHDGGKK